MWMPTGDVKKLKNVTILKKKNYPIIRKFLSKSIVLFLGFKRSAKRANEIFVVNQDLLSSSKIQFLLIQIEFTNKTHVQYFNSVGLLKACF